MAPSRVETISEAVDNGFYILTKISGTNLYKEYVHKDDFLRSNWTDRMFALGTSSFFSNVVQHSQYLVNTTNKISEPTGNVFSDQIRLIAPLPKSSVCWRIVLKLFLPQKNSNDFNEDVNLEFLKCKKMVLVGYNDEIVKYYREIVTKDARIRNKIYPGKDAFHPSFAYVYFGPVDLDKSNVVSNRLKGYFESSLLTRELF